MVFIRARRRIISEVGFIRFGSGDYPHVLYLFSLDEIDAGDAHVVVFVHFDDCALGTRAGVGHIAARRFHRIFIRRNVGRAAGRKARIARLHDRQFVVIGVMGVAAD